MIAATPVISAPGSGAGVAPFEPDVAQPGSSDDGETFARALGEAIDRASSALRRAHRAESDFRSGRAGLQEMVVERAQADITLTIAAATASRLTQSLSTLLNMQV